MARTLGKAVRDFKEAANTVQREIHESASVEEIKEVKQPSPAPTIPQQATPITSTTEEINTGEKN